MTWLRGQLARWQVAGAGRARLAAQAARGRERDAETAARRAADLALDAARALDQGEWDHAGELLARARRCQLDALVLLRGPVTTGGGWGR